MTATGSSSNFTLAVLIAAAFLTVPSLRTAAARALAHSDPTQPAQAAIAASLNAARNVSATVTALARSGGLKPREAAAVNDCIATVADSVEELRRSLETLRSSGGGGKGAVTDRVKDVQTWVSAALTDETTCMDGFEDGEMDGDVRRRVRGQIARLARMISHALALVSGLANY